MSGAGPAAALDIAATIGFGIARKAIWSGDRCSWLESYPVMPGQNPAVSAMAGPDVYGGTSGIGWFLAEAAARTGEPLLLRTARGALRQAAARAREQLEASPHGFYGGAAGTGAALVLAGRTAADEETVAAGRALLLDCPVGTDAEFATDIISGLAGTILSLGLAADALGGDGALLARAGENAAALIARGVRGPGGTLSWATMPERRANLAGFGHGTAGIAHCLLVLDALAPDRALPEAAEAAFVYERAVYDAAQANWPDFRIMPGTPQDQIFFPVAWCHGAGGIVQQRIAARSVAGPAVEAEIAAGLPTVARELGRMLSTPGGDLTLCHGLLGLADVIVDASRAGYREHDALLGSCIGGAVEAFHEGERPWPSGLLTREEIGGLMMGNAGIGWFFLRLADAGLESVLMPGASLLGRRTAMRAAA